MTPRMPAVSAAALAVAATLALAPPPAVPTPAQYEACNRTAAARVQTSPAPAPSSTPGGAPAPVRRDPAIVSPPGAPGAGPLLHDDKLLEQADPRYRDNAVFRTTFLDCLRRLPG